MPMATVTQDVSQCSTCAHFRSWVVTGTTTYCAAFPAGMPDTVWSNTVDHRQPVDGDNGVQWESNGESYPVQGASSDGRYWEGEWERLAGTDTHPGGEGLKHWWTETPEGLAEWVDSEHPYTTLYEKLLEHMDGNEVLAHKTAGAWYFKVFGHGPTAAGHDRRGFRPDLHPHYSKDAPGGKGGEFRPSLGLAAKKAAFDGPALQAIYDDIKAKSATDARKQLTAMRLLDLRELMKHAGLKGGKTKADLVDRLVGSGPIGGPNATPATTKAASAARRPPAKPVAIHNLIAADDATIDAALRDVYEGEFGPYATKVQVSITRAETKKTKDGREREIEPSIGVSGDIYNSAGHKIGDFGRTISQVALHYPDAVRREVWAEHQIVQFYDAKDQGKGFGGEFNRRAIDWYRASGVHGISQHDHNGYVWASQGFGFRGGVVPIRVAQNLRDLIADLRAGKAKSEATKDEYRTIPKRFREASDLNDQIATAEALLARLESTRPGAADYPTAYEMSQLGRRSGQRGKTSLWLGKLLWVPADELILNSGEGTVVSQ